MGNCFGQALCSKIKGMYSKNLTIDDYSELVNKRTIVEVASYLKNTKRYGDILEGIKDTAVHRGQLENLVKERAFIDMLKLRPYFPRGKSEYYSYPRIEVEIQQILNKLRNIQSEEKSGYKNQTSEFLSGYVCFDLSKIDKVETFQQLLNALEQTPYYKILKACHDKDQPHEFIYINCERVLQNFFFENIEIKIKQCFTGDNRRILMRYFNMKKDIQNITTAYRLRKYFKFSSKDIEKLLIPYTKNGKDDRDIRMNKLRHKILEAKTEEDVIRAVKNSGYSKIQDDSIMEFEKKFEKMMYKRCKRHMMFADSPEIVYTSFLFLELVEMENIVMVIEGVRYNIPPDKIKDMLLV